MRTSHALPVALALVLSACAADAPTAPVELAALDAHDALRGPRLPHTIRGSCTTTFPPAPFPPPPVLEQTDVGECQLSHLGRTVLRSVKEIHFATGTQITKEITLTAANGDVLRGTGVGSNRPGAPGTIAFDAVMTIDGGTGRFEGASGTLQVSGVATFATSSAAITIDGTVSY